MDCNVTDSQGSIPDKLMAFLEDTCRRIDAINSPALQDNCHNDCPSSLPILSEDFTSTIRNDVTDFPDLEALFPLDFEPSNQKLFDAPPQLADRSTQREDVQNVPESATSFPTDFNSTDLLGLDDSAWFHNTHINFEMPFVACDDNSLLKNKPDVKENVPRSNNNCKVETLDCQPVRKENANATSLSHAEQAESSQEVTRMDGQVIRNSLPNHVQAVSEAQRISTGVKMRKVHETATNVGRGKMGRVEGLRVDATVMGESFSNGKGTQRILEHYFGLEESESEDDIPPLPTYIPGIKKKDLRNYSTMVEKATWNDAHGITTMFKNHTEMGEGTEIATTSLAGQAEMPQNKRVTTKGQLEMKKTPLLGISQGMIAVLENSNDMEGATECTKMAPTEHIEIARQAETPGPHDEKCSNCRICDIDFPTARDLCKACTAYFIRTGHPRPERMFARYAMDAEVCCTCGHYVSQKEDALVKKGVYRCRECRIEAASKERRQVPTERRKQPKRNMRKDLSCSNCSLTKASFWRLTKDGDHICGPCFVYEGRMGVNRPSRLWGRENRVCKGRVQKKRTIS